MLNIENILIEFSGTTFSQHYRASDWLLHKLIEIEDEHKKEIEREREDAINGILNKTEEISSL